MIGQTAPLLEVTGVSKYFGRVTALEDVSMTARAGRVTCLLGDNGAGKSTLIKILSGVLRPSAGRYELEGRPVELRSPAHARDRGIATVYQDLAMVPLMSVWRNFFLGSEPTRGRGLFRRIDVKRCDEVTRGELSRIGIEIEDSFRPVATLSGGERQSVAIARALYFGAKVLILDEPTAALGVKQAATVLDDIRRAKERGIGVIFVTHNPYHAHAVADRFVVLRRGRVIADAPRDAVSLEELTRLMAGGEELQPPTDGS